MQPRSSIAIAHLTAHKAPAHACWHPVEHNHPGHDGCLGRQSLQVCPATSSTTSHGGIPRKTVRGEAEGFLCNQICLNTTKSVPRSLQDIKNPHDITTKGCAQSRANMSMAVCCTVHTAQLQPFQGFAALCSQTTSTADGTGCFGCVEWFPFPAVPGKGQLLLFSNGDCMRWALLGGTRMLHMQVKPLLLPEDRTAT